MERFPLRRTLAELPLAWWPSAAACEVWRGADLNRMALKARSETPSVACVRQGHRWSGLRPKVVRPAPRAGCGRPEPETLNPDP